MRVQVAPPGGPGRGVQGRDRPASGVACCSVSQAEICHGASAPAPDEISFGFDQSDRQLRNHAGRYIRSASTEPVPIIEIMRFYRKLFRTAGTISAVESYRLRRFGQLRVSRICCFSACAARILFFGHLGQSPSPLPWSAVGIAVHRRFAVAANQLARRNLLRRACNKITPGVKSCSLLRTQAHDRVCARRRATQ